MRFSAIVSSVLCTSSALAASSLHKRNVFNRVKPLVEWLESSQQHEYPEPRGQIPRFLTEKTKKFAVDGSSIPEVSFDVGESYAGLLPISDDPKETRKLFFWFFPTVHEDPNEEIVIWLNGGPGCSSLAGFLTENGPFTWQAGTAAPLQNSYSWTNLTNMIWIEQPVGVGYSQGSPNITDEVELATQFRGFWKSFFDTFELHNWKTYVTGESYAGYYVPYIADGFISANDPRYFNLAGVSINNPIIGDDTVQQQVVILPYVEYWNNIMYLNSTFLSEIRQLNAECNYTSYGDSYFKFPPPKGPFPVLPDPFTTDTHKCDMFDAVYSAALEVNPCFNIYHISQTCPFPYNPLGATNTGDYLTPNAQVYFNRTDVQKALHAVVGTNWSKCSLINVFGNGNDNSDAADASVGPANNGVLQRVIEHTNNTIIGSGDLDMLLNTNGTLFAIQNMTWNGRQGLQEYPSKALYAPYHREYNLGVLAGAGIQGKWTRERGLTFYAAQLAGHELPGYTPGVAFRMLEILLGRVEDFGSKEGFTTQKGNFTGAGTVVMKQGEKAEGKDIYL